MEKLKKPKFGCLTIYCKALEKEYYGGQVNREQFSLNMLPEEASEYIADFCVYRNGDRSEKVILIKGKNTTLAIPLASIESMYFTV